MPTRVSARYVTTGKALLRLGCVHTPYVSILAPKAIFITFSGVNKECTCFISDSGTAFSALYEMGDLHFISFVVCYVCSREMEQVLTTCSTADRFNVIFQSVSISTWACTCPHQLKTSQKTSTSGNKQFLVAQFPWKKVLIQGKCITIPKFPQPLFLVTISNLHSKLWTQFYFPNCANKIKA